MTLTTEQATLRASFRRELLRLRARPFEGGPMHATRQGVLLAFDDSDERCVEVKSEAIERLKALPDGAGVEEVWRALA